MHLLMRTYRQDRLCAWITHFSHTGVLVIQSFHAKDLFHYSIVQK